MMTIEQALAYWVDKKKITPKKALELVDCLPAKLREHDQKEEMSHRAIGIFSSVGAILLGLGVILFVSSNWSAMTAMAKVSILLAGMIATAGAGYYLAYEKHTYEKTGLALLFVNILIFGASIFLVAQIYQLPLNFWLGALLWFIVTLGFAAILQSRLHLWTSVPLLLLFLGWLRVSLYGGSGQLDFLFDDRHSLLNMLPIIGVGLVSGGILLRRSSFLSFGTKTLFHWGIFLLVFIVVLGTVDKEVFFPVLQATFDTVNVVTAIVAFALLGIAFFRAPFETPQGRWGLLALGLYTVFLYVLAWLPSIWVGPMGSGFAFYQYSDVPAFQMLFILHVVLAFIFLFVLVWYGTLLRMSVLINIGMIGIGFIIFIQYFSWAFQMLDRSLAFILGGFLILGLSAILERQRRKILTSIGK